MMVGMMAALLSAPSCNPTTIDPVSDPNNPSIDSVLSNASQIQISALGTGVEASFRLGHTNNAPYYQITGTLGREIIILASNEPRWYTEILGTRGPLNNNSFYSVGSYNAFARTIRAANVFRQSALATNSITASQQQAVLGFSDTYEALAKLHLLNLMGENGIRIDVADFLNPGKFTAGSAPALVNIRQLLDQGATELAKASTFPFVLSTGYAGFDTPATFLLFNRALAARVALYQKDYPGALIALKASFYSPTTSLAIGPKLTFNPSIANDQGNAYYQAVGAMPSTLTIVPDNFVAEAEKGDLRLSKVANVPGIRSNGGITGNWVPTIYTNQLQPLDIIRNEELVLISAEVKANTGDITGAVADINVIRSKSGGLAAYSGAMDVASLTNEILRQRRYSLFYEGQFWVDLRRLGKLNPTPTPQITLPYSTAPFQLFDRLAIPQAEIAWDQAHP
ncbi:hypothetical protein A0257_09875 [Hymenobacter psoromatis]|nr:hypothetical protein A0257_09875 [Hymenobacter psoromatis]